jgi:hypothetical protein
MAYSANIKKEQLKLDSQYIEQDGYYTLTISDDSKKGLAKPYEVYLQPGHYDITLDTIYKGTYPQITSPSPVQQQLSAYYTTVSLLHNWKFINQQIKLAVNLPREELMSTINKLRSLDDNTGADPAEKAVLAQVIKQNPHSLIAAHIMQSMDFNTDAAKFYALYQSLSPEARSTDEDKQLGKKLSKLAKLVPGGTAPMITGTTPDGKPFNPADFKKKIYLLEFWKSGNDMSRVSHSPDGVKAMLGQINKPGDFGMIGISLDSKKDWWTSAIKDDKMTWAQFSDLKGNESANASDWGITRIPTYYLVTGDWKIVERDLMLSEVPVVVNQYIDHHR